MRLSRWRSVGSTRLSGIHPERSDGQVTVLCWSRSTGGKRSFSTCDGLEINLTKGTYQNRGRQVVVLARLDFGGAPHRNPDGETKSSPPIFTFTVRALATSGRFRCHSQHFTYLDDPWQIRRRFHAIL